MCLKQLKKYVTCQLISFSILMATNPFSQPRNACVLASSQVQPSRSLQFSQHRTMSSLALQPTQSLWQQSQAQESSLSPWPAWPTPSTLEEEAIILVQSTVLTEQLISQFQTVAMPTLEASTPLWRPSDHQRSSASSTLPSSSAGNVCFGRAVGIADDKVIPDNQISASSWHDSDYLPHYGRLHGNRGKGWCAKSSSTNMDWLMVDLGKTFEICGVATQGSVHSWVTDFMLTYSVDGNNWNGYLDLSGAIMIFQRIGKSQAVDQHSLTEPFPARYIRFQPTNQKHWNCLRVEVYGIFIGSTSSTPPQASSVRVQPSRLQQSSQHQTIESTVQLTQSPQGHQCSFSPVASPTLQETRSILLARSMHTQQSLQFQTVLMSTLESPIPFRQPSVHTRSSCEYHDPSSASLKLPGSSADSKEYQVKVVVHSTSSSTIDVSWEPINPDHSYGIPLGYQVKFAKDDGYPPRWTVNRLCSTTFKLTLRELEYFTRYKIVICALTSRGCGQEYSTISYTWGAVPDRPPKNVTALNLTSESTISVSWDPVPDGHMNGLLMGYIIKYKRTRTAERDVQGTEEITIALKPNDLSTVLHVQTDSVYWIKVAAFTQRGMGAFSKYTHAETCRCPPVLYTNVWSVPPYLTVNDKDAKLEGIFSEIILEMMKAVCGFCPSHGNTVIDITSNGKGRHSAKKNILGVLADIDEVPQISFPIYGNRYITTYLGDYAYINIVESPGVAFIAATKPAGHSAKELFSAVLDSTPLLMLLVCFVYTSGFVVWLSDTMCSPHEFPASIFRGAGEGFWCSFISMTTVGYGDRVPKSIPARIFSIISILTGLIVISILIGTMATSLTAVTLEKDVILYGTKIGAIENSTEYTVGVLKNARVNTERHYTTLDELRKALEDGEIEGALLDTYIAAEEKETFLNDRVFVKKIFKRPVGYGVVLSGAARNLEQRCRDYIALHIDEIFRTIQNKTRVLDASDEAIKASTGLFDPNSKMFISAIAFLVGLTFAAFVAGLLYQYLIFAPGKKKNMELSASSCKFAHKDSIVKEMKEIVDSFYSSVSIKIKEMKKRQMRDILTVAKSKHMKKDYTSRSKMRWNSVYSPITKPADSSKRLVHFTTANSIVKQAQEWPASQINTYPSQTSLGYDC